MMLNEKEFDKLQSNKVVVFVVKNDRVFTNFLNDNILYLQKTTLLCEDGRKSKGAVFFKKYFFDLLKCAINDDYFVYFYCK